MAKAMKEAGPTFPVGELLAGCSVLLGIERHVAAGAMALAGVTDIDRMTTEEFKAAVVTFLAHPVR